MGDADYEMALMLQRQFEEEQKWINGPKENPGDLQMARLLQQEFEREQARSSYSNILPNGANQIYQPSKENPEDVQMAELLQRQFEQEHAVEKPVNNLYYSDKKNKNKDPTKSLIDPSWELVDPTPNIHNLFIAFNER